MTPSATLLDVRGLQKRFGGYSAVSGVDLTVRAGTVHAVTLGRVADRDVIVSGSFDRRVRVWDAVTGQPVGPPLEGHAGRVYAVALGRFGGRQVIVSGGQDGTLRLWDAVTCQPVGDPLVGHSGTVHAVALGRSGERARTRRNAQS